MIGIAQARASLEITWQIMRKYRKHRLVVFSPTRFHGTPAGA